MQERLLICDVTQWAGIPRFFPLASVLFCMWSPPTTRKRGRSRLKTFLLLQKKNLSLDRVSTVDNKENAISSLAFSVISL